MSAIPRVTLISLEPWDQLWRRNQHLSSQLVRQGLVEHLLFVNPPTRARAPSARHSPQPGVTVVTPVQRIPKRLGGTRLVARGLRRSVPDTSVLWINDPVLGAASMTAGIPAVYDVTDDWRTAPAPPRIVRRVTRAEDRLAVRARTVVCSEELRARWRKRYNVESALVHNAVDSTAWEGVRPMTLPGAGPHVGYVGTLHQERLDLDLVENLAADKRIGTVHLVGPDALDADSRRRLQGCPKLVMHGPVPSSEVPSWTVSLDVLVSPHRISPFTMSLDAIKSYEYLASGRPVVATPTSGFQHLRADSLTVVKAHEFADAVHRAAARPHPMQVVDVPTWAQRAREFAAVLDETWLAR